MWAKTMLPENRTLPLDSDGLVLRPWINQGLCPPEMSCVDGTGPTDVFFQSGSDQPLSGLRCLNPSPNWLFTAGLASCCRFFPEILTRLEDGDDRPAIAVPTPAYGRHANRIRPLKRPVTPG